MASTDSNPSQTSERDARLAITMLAAAAVLFKGQQEDDLIQSGEFLHGLTGDLLEAYFPEERAPLMRSIEAAFDQPLVAGTAVEAVERKILIDFIRGVNAGQPDALHLLDTITAYLEHEQEEAREEREVIFETAVRDAIQNPPSDGEEMREIIGPNGERIVMRILNGGAISVEPDEYDQERHDEPEESDDDGAVFRDVDEAGRVDPEAEGDGPAPDGAAAEDGPVA